jgi:hypothetical protein
MPDVELVALPASNGIRGNTQRSGQPRLAQSQLQAPFTQVLWCHALVGSLYTLRMVA